MKSFFEKMTRSEMVMGIVFVVLGLVFLIWPGVSMQIACRGIGVLMLAYGVVQTIVYLRCKEKTIITHGMFMVGLVVGVLGAWIALQPETVLVMLPIIIGVIILLHGIQNVVQAVALKKQSYQKWWLAGIFGLATISLGLLLAVNPFKAVEMMIRMIGLFLLCDGASNIWIQSRISANG